MDECSTPTERRLGVYIDRVIERLAPTVNAGENPSLDELMEIFLVCSRNGGEPPEDCEPNIIECFKILKHLSNRDALIAEGINAAMMCLGTALLGATLESSVRAHSREMASLRGINARNKALSDTAERARKIATGFWGTEDYKQSRIGDMAQLVYAELHAQGMQKLLPKDPDGVRKWIRPVAPPHAMKPGRSKKSG